MDYREGGSGGRARGERGVKKRLTGAGGGMYESQTWIVRRQSSGREARKAGDGGRLFGG